MQIYGLTAATSLAGWSVAAEARLPERTFRADQRQTTLLQAALLGAGPYGAAGRAAVKEAKEPSCRYTKFDKTQFRSTR